MNHSFLKTTTRFVFVPFFPLSTPQTFAAFVNFWSLIKTSKGISPALMPHGITASSSFTLPCLTSPTSNATCSPGLKIRSTSKKFSVISLSHCSAFLVIVIGTGSWIYPTKVVAGRKTARQCKMPSAWPPFAGPGLCPWMQAMSRDGWRPDRRCYLKASGGKCDIRGELRVEIGNEAGDVLTEFEAENCRPLRLDTVNHTVL